MEEARRFFPAMDSSLRRQFLQQLATAAFSSLVLSDPAQAQAPAAGSEPGSSQPLSGSQTVPSYLREYEALYRENPRAAAEWHRNAKWGLFIHYALETLRGLTAQEVLKAKAISSDVWKNLKSAGVDYARLRDRFTAESFDADFITDLALAAEMRYINFTTRHRGDLYMFRTRVSEFTSLNSPAKRDLVEELAAQCRKKGLGLFLYCPPDVARTEPQQLFERNCTVIQELLTQYGPVAGIWLDGIGSYYANPEAYGQLGELYALIRSLQPQCLISFKQGTGTEDFVAPEGLMHAKSGVLAEKAWAMNAGKRGDICTNMQTAPPSWLYLEGCEHINVDEALALLADAFAQGANLTLNTGLLPDGSIHPADVATLREAGAPIRKHGFPSPALMDREKRRRMKKLT